MQRMIFLVLVTSCLSGCSFLWSALFGKERDPHKEHFNSLWEEGYGFNNPNPQRIRDGQEPQPFFKD